jgi:hypothetical protein
MQKFDVESFNFNKVNYMEVNEQYKIKISKGFTALENLILKPELNGCTRF